MLRLFPMAAVLLQRLMRDPRVGRRNKLAMIAVAGYLASPIDVIPDFLPGIGQLDDMILVGFALRGLIRSVGHDVILEHWPGSDAELDVLLRFADRRVRQRS